MLCKPRGFCAGVVRAIDTVNEALRVWGPPIYVKHEIVHNRHVVESLRIKGAVFVEELDEIPVGSRVIYSAHGVSPAVREVAKLRQLKEIDATCGLVTRVHSAAKRYASKGYKIVLIGHKTHVEVIGTAGEAPDSTWIVESVGDVQSLPFEKGEPLFYVTQTTLSLDDVQEIVEALRNRYPQIETLPSSSICYATTNRQMALREISGKVDLVLVVGDPQSSNSNRLVEAALQRGIKAYLINSRDEIQQDWFKDVSVIGMTAGASTPESIVQECIRTLELFGVDTIEELSYIEEDVFFQLPKEILIAK